jgi:cobalamin biosynthesis Mg chelatase CobN
LKSPTTSTEGLEIVKSQTDLTDSLDPEGLAIFGQDMNDEQKANLFLEMAAQIHAQLLEDDSIEKQEELAQLTIQVINMIAKAGFEEPQAAQNLYSEMTLTIVEQLEGRQSPDMVDANSLSAEAVEKLADAAAVIVKANKAAQPKLMEALEMGLLRASGEINASE